MLKKIHFGEFIRLMAMMKKRLWMYCAGIIFFCASFTSYLIIIALVNKKVIDAVTSGQMKMLVNAVILLLIALFILCFVYPFTIYLKQYSLKNAIIEIRLRIFKQLEDLPISYFEARHSGDTISRITNDMSVFEQAYDWHIHGLATSISTGTGALVTMLFLNWKLGLIMIALGLASAMVNVLFATPMRKVSNDIQSKLSLLTQNLGDIMAGFRVLKIFNIGKIVLERFLVNNNEIADKSLNRVLRVSQMNGLNAFLSSFSFLGVFVIGSFMVSAGTASFGSLMAILSIQFAVTNMFLNVGNIFARLQATLAGAARVFEFMDEKIEPERYNVLCDDKCRNACGKNDTIVFKDIHFDYEKRESVLNGLNLSVSKGQIAALVGPSGGGKSTVIKLLMGFYPPRSGCIAVNGKPIGEYSMEELRTFLSYVPQDAYLFDGTIEDNIRYGRFDATKEEIIQAARGANAHDFILETPEGYSTRVGERGLKLSGGQRQRIAIARALLKDAPILLLDEATSSLDSESEQLVQQALNELMKGRTTIAVAHRLSTIEHADVIYVIDNGKVSEQGSHDDLVSQDGLYKYLYQLGNIDTELEVG